jgi:hypothetical protein
MIGHMFLKNHFDNYVEKSFSYLLATQVENGDKKTN